MDNIDIKIINILKENARKKISEIANELSLPITTVHNRIKKIEREGLIKKYVAIPDYSKLGKSITAFVLVNIKSAIGGEKIMRSRLTDKLKSIECIESIYLVTGDVDIIAKVRVGSINELNDLLLNKIRKIDIVEKTKTMIVLTGYEDI